MTNEEAIETLKYLKHSLMADSDYDRAVDLAIKALEQTDKIEESNFSTEQYKADLQGAYDCGYRESRFAKPKKGKWIKGHFNGSYHCSECDYIEDGKTTYCAHCGARMIPFKEDSE